MWYGFLRHSRFSENDKKVPLPNTSSVNYNVNEVIAVQRWQAVRCSEEPKVKSAIMYHFCETNLLYLVMGSSQQNRIYSH